jgi:hypothetical protein
MRKPYLGFLLLLMFGSLLVPVSAPAAHAGIGVSITVAPPVIPVYTQPICPGPNYIWTPGYWAWGDDGYYWVPGTWVVAQPWDCCGLRATGVGVTASTCGTRGIGDRT